MSAKSFQLHQAIALRPDREKSFKVIWQETIHLFKNPAIFAAKWRSIRAHDDARAKELNSDVCPAVGTTVGARLEYTLKQIAGFINLEATINSANASAKADVIIDGVVIAPQVNVCTLLTLEKLAEQWIAVVNEIPTLEQTTSWVEDLTHALKGIWKTAFPIVAKQNEKQHYVITESVATVQFAAKTSLAYKDVPIADITDTYYSGKITSAAKADLMANAVKFKEAVNVARGEANKTESPDVNVMLNVGAFLLTGKIA